MTTNASSGVGVRGSEDSAEKAATTQGILCRDLRFSYGPRQVLRGLDLTVAPGECLVLFGGNGAGKTTLVRILATLVRPTSGEAWVGGFNVATEPSMVRPMVGVVSHQMYLFPDLTARENLELYASLYEVSDGPGRIAELLGLVGLARRANDLVRTMSRGMQQRLSLARALLGGPQVLLLDEPDTGLDSVALQVLSQVLSEGLGNGLTVLVATHRIGEGYRLGTRFGVLARGKLAFEASRESMSVEELECRYRAYLDGHHP
ncbi:MAG: transporter related protein [Dehalococcoidia bacterium]|nr:transporter related protein [Dehalococcoidia bacterium]